MCGRTIDVVSLVVATVADDIAANDDSDNVDAFTDSADVSLAMAHKKSVIFASIIE